MIESWDVLMKIRGVIYAADVEKVSLRKETNKVGHWGLPLST